MSETERSGQGKEEEQIIYILSIIIESYFIIYFIIVPVQKKIHCSDWLEGYSLSSGHF